METVKVDRQKLLDIYKTADESKRKEMEDLYGAEVFQLKEIERIRSFEDACADQGLNPDEVLPWKNLVAPASDDEDQEYLDKQFDNTNVKLRIIAKSLKAKEKVDWHSNDKKWRPWFDFNRSTSAFGFAYSDYDYTCAHSIVGSRFCFSTEEKSNYFGKQFIDLHNIVLLK